MKFRALIVCMLICSIVAVLNIDNNCSGLKTDDTRSPRLLKPPRPLVEPIMLRIITYNVQDLWIIGKDRIKRMKALGKKLTELDPDIAGFQEAFIDRDRQVLIESLSHSRLKFYRYFPSGVVGSGLLVASAYPIKEALFHRYAASNPWYKIWEGDWWAGKGIALARIELPDGRGCFDVYNTHVQAGYRKHLYTNDYNEIRGQQMSELADFINSTKTKTGPVFLVGDMNCGQGSENFKIAAGKANLVRVMAVDSGVDHIFAVHDPRYVFEVMENIVVAEHEGLRLSDHNGYMSTIQITPVSGKTGI